MAELEGRRNGNFIGAASLPNLQGPTQDGMRAAAVRADPYQAGDALPLVVRSKAALICEAMGENSDS